jgi:drug/metabolite transporter (DMT)-like permease
LSGATLLVLASAALHAGWNAALKKRSDPRVAAVLILVVAAACATIAAALARAPAFPSREALGWALASGVGEALYFATLARALAHAPLGVAYTVSRGGSILLVWPLSVAFLGEEAHAASIAGAGLVFVGLVLAGASEPRARATHARGLAWAIACAVFVAGVYLAYKRALALDAEPNALFALSLALAAPINVALLGARPIPRLVAELRAAPLSACAAGVVCAASFLLFLGALHASGAGRVLTLRNTSVVFALGFAWIGGERPARAPAAGAAFVVTGAMLLG